MNITILTPEEEIITYMRKGLLEELPVIINEINEERGEIWAEELTEVSNIENTTARLPKAYMNISKVKKQNVDINFMKEEYILNLSIAFKDNKNRVIGFRYTYLINELFKISTNISKIADRVLIEELQYQKNQRGDVREPATIVFKIIITKETS